MTSKKSMLGLLVAGLILAAPATAAADNLQTWDLKSRFVTKSDALHGLTAAQAADEGPTGLRVRVLLPDGYTPSRCWPVLYLLHGTGSATGWLNQLDRTKPLNAVVVVPGAGDVQFIDWYGGGPKWERWWFEELMPTVNRRLSICPDRKDHSIAGASAGGYAAFYLASQQPQDFGSAGAFSGSLSMERPEVPVAYGDFTTIFGPPGGFYAMGKNPVRLVDGLRSTRLFMTWGDGSPLPGDPEPAKAGFAQVAEQEMRAMSLDFLAAARKAHVAVRWSEGPGMHNFRNWGAGLSSMVAWNPFAPVTDPATWDVTTVRQEGDVWGYHYRFAKAPAGLVQLSLRNGRLRVLGDGKVRITPPKGAPLTATAPFELAEGRAIPVHDTSVAGGGGDLGSLKVRPLKPRTRTPLTVTWPSGSRPAGTDRLEVIVYQTGKSCSTTTYAKVTWHKGTITRTIQPPRRGKRRAWCRGRALLVLQTAPKSSGPFTIGKVRRVGNAIIRR